MRERDKKSKQGKNVNSVGRPRTVKITSEEKHKCRVCAEVYPYTSEYFPVNKRYKSGLDTRCRKCQNAYDREKYATRRAKESKDYEPKTEYQELIEKRDKRDEEAYKKLVSEVHDKGIGDKLDTLKFQIGKKYKIERRKNKENDYENLGAWTMVQDCKDHITLRHKRGYCESFRKYDFLCGDYKVAEVMK